MNPRRLYRSRRDRQLAGVAGGIAEYLEIDPTVVRILWILSVFLGGFGILLYIIMAFVVPLEPVAGPLGGPWQAPGSWQAPASSGPAPAAGPMPAAGDGTAAPTGAEAPGTEATGTEASDAEATRAEATAAGPAGSPRAAGPSWAANPAWAASPSWTAPASGTPDDRRGGRGSLYLGVILVVFGAIAMANVMIPGVAASGVLWAGLAVAVGVALLVGAARRKAVAP